MAEKSGELNKIDKLDPVSTTAGAGSDQYLEKYSEDYSDVEGQELAADSGDDATEETEQIRARIEETRSQMGETIDAIQEKLSFSNISDQVSETVSNAIETAKDTAYDATIGKAVNFMRNVGDGVSNSGAIQTVKNNPFPLALIGIGAGLMVYQSMNPSSSRRRGNGRGYQKHFRGSEYSGERSSFDSTRRAVSNTAGAAYDGITEKASGALTSVGNVAGTAYESVTGAVGNVKSGAEDLAQRAYERAGEYGSLAQEKYDEYLEENPLALGALAVAVGAAVGFALPSTNYEGRLMGEARENLMHRAQEAAGSLVDKAKHVAAEAGQTIKDEAQALTQ